MKICSSTLREMRVFFENRLFIDRKQSRDWVGALQSSESTRQTERFLELLKQIEKLTE